MGYAKDIQRVEIQNGANIIGKTYITDGTNLQKVNSDGSTNATILGTPTVYAQNKILTPAAYTTAITVATPYSSSIIDGGSTLIYKTFRLAVLYDQPVKVEIFNGASSTLTSNKIMQTVTVPANTPTTIDYPISARYYGFKITNTGAATTTIQNAQWVSFSQ